MSKLLDQFNKVQLKSVPEIRPGDTIKVHQKITEGNKERLQVFEGIVVARKHGKGINSTITVRKVVDGVGVERVFPVHSPVINKIEVTKRSKVRRSKLYYLREAKGKKARLKRKELKSPGKHRVLTQKHPVLRRALKKPKKKLQKKNSARVVKWYTRHLEVVVLKGVQVRLLSRAQRPWALFTALWTLSSVGRATRLHRVGHRFESYSVHNK